MATTRGGKSGNGGGTRNGKTKASKGTTASRAARGVAKAGARASAAPPRKEPRKARPKSSADEARRVALVAAEAGLDKKALNVEIIDVRGKVDYADYVVVLSGRSDRQVGAIARGIEEEVKKREGIRCVGLEGLPQGNWVLMDFGDVVVHVFHEDMRGYYDLESLWIDAARVHVDQHPD